jgi:hypothetical protein
MFGAGSIVGPTQTGSYELVIGGVTNVPRIFAYFNSGDFVGIKVRSYRLFKEVNLLFQKKVHLNSQERAAIDKLCRSINNDYRMLKLAKQQAQAYAERCLSFIE